MDFFSSPSLLLLSVFLFLIYLFLRHHHQPKKSTTAHVGFKNYPLLGTLPDFILNRHGFLEWSTSALKSTPTNTAVFHRPGGVNGIITANPSNVEHILKSNFQNYPKGPRFISLLQDFLGQGIFNSDYALWKLQRKTASYEFNKRSLKNFVLDSVKSEIQKCLTPLLEECSRSGRILDLQDVLERFAFDNVCKLAFNVDPGCLSSGYGSGFDEFMKAFEVATNLSAGRFMCAFPSVWKIMRFFDVGSERKLRESIEIVHRFADNIIRSRLAKISDDDDDSGGRHRTDDDLLSRFIAATEENSPEFLRDIVISFILAGRDTTSSGLSWFFWLLSHHPHVTEKIRSEVKQIRAQRTDTTVDLQPSSSLPTFHLDELREMHYLHAAISESMRLYPPVPIDTKACLADDVLPNGTVIKKGWLVSYHTYAMGRMVNIWGPDCEEFRPERWIDENGMCKVENMFKYPVFHAGPRICLGREMAFIQMKSIVACVLEKFDVDVVSMGKMETPPEYVLSLTMRMKHGLNVGIHQRSIVNSSISS